jgi:hypothetical protein
MQTTAQRYLQHQGREQVDLLSTQDAPVGFEVGVRRLSIISVTILSSG